MDIMKNRPTLLAAAAVLALGAAACSETTTEPVASTTVTNGMIAEAPQAPASSTTVPLDTTAGTTADTTGGTAAATGDASISLAVKNELLKPDMNAVNVEVATVGGIVTLSGKVDQPEKVEQAKTVAQSVAGVIGVENQLTVETG